MQHFLDRSDYYSVCKLHCPTPKCAHANEHKEKNFGHIDLATECDEGLGMACLSECNLRAQ